VITTLVAGLALAAPSFQSDWTPARFTPEVLAKRVDDRLATLKKATLKYHFIYQKATFGHGESVCDCTFVDPNRFWIMVPKLDPAKESEGIENETWVADGKNFGKAVLPKDAVPGPMANRPKVPAKALSAWFTNFSKVILAGVGRPTKPLQSLVADARRQGFRTVAETRSFPYQGRTFVSHRLTLSKGPARYEIVVDPRGDVPVTITNTIGKDFSRWVQVDWNLRPKGKEYDPNNARFLKGAPAPNTVLKPRRP